MKKRVLIIGPFNGMGGREIEASLIIDFIKDQDITILSSKKKLETHNNSITITNRLKKINILYFLSAVLSRRFRFKEDLYSFYSNRITKKLFPYNKDITRILEKEINEADLVISFFSLNSREFKLTAEICNTLKKPQIVRTTNVIKQLPNGVLNLIGDLKQVIHHTSRNAKLLENQVKHNITLIDQCASNEKDLLKQDINLETDKITFGFIGRLVKGKGGLKVCEIFKEYGIEDKLLIAGSGPETETIKKCIIGTNISMLGEISGEQLIRFYKEIDCLIIASDEETGPLVGVEAMAAGNIIISTDVGAMKNRLGDKAFWFDLDNKLTLVKCIKSIKNMSTENALKRKKEMRQLYLSNNSMTLIQQKYRDIIL